MKYAPVAKLAVAGLGLLGGSLALAARRRGLAERVVGLARRAETAREAVALGAVDEAGTEVARVLPGTDLLVLATPIHAMEGVLTRAAPHLAEGACVTDVGSVKGRLVDTLPGLLPPGVHYVGAHPMAGSHRRSLEHAREDLFEGAPCVLTPAPGVPEAAVARVRALFLGLGARVLERDPAQHDDEVGWVSHVPHALAFAFAHALRAAPAGAAEVQGPGFRDFTRIARSDAELWADILSTNRKALAGPLALCAEALRELAVAIEDGDAEAVERFLTEAGDSLARLPMPDPGARTRKSHSRRSDDPSQ